MERGPADIKRAALVESTARLRATREGLLHIVSSAEWAAVSDQYVPHSLHEEGFIHCSTGRTYGPLPKDSVVGVVEFPPEPDGSFRLPASLRV